MGGKYWDRGQYCKRCGRHTRTYCWLAQRHIQILHPETDLREDHGDAPMKADSMKVSLEEILYYHSVTTSS